MEQTDTILRRCELPEALGKLHGLVRQSLDQLPQPYQERAQTMLRALNFKTTAELLGVVHEDLPLFRRLCREVPHFTGLLERPYDESCRREVHQLVAISALGTLSDAYWLFATYEVGRQSDVPSRRLRSVIETHVQQHMRVIRCQERG